MNEEKRFWNMTLKGEEKECWTWTGNKSRGYGTLSTRHGKAPEKAHRLSWKIHYGDIPKGMYVCHSCDNPSCVNPNHLFLGTAKDNTRDAVRKGRIGKHPNSLANLHPGEIGKRGAGTKSNRELGVI